jgi:hypothetical protein
MNTQSKIGARVIGLGFMGSTRVGPYQAAKRAGHRGCSRNESLRSMYVRGNQRMGIPGRDAAK